MTYEAIMPLKLIGNEEHTGSILIATQDNSDLCEFFFSEVHTVSHCRKDALTAARLMVAAPQLLAALQSLADNPTPEAISQAKALIAVVQGSAAHV